MLPKKSILIKAVCRGQYVCSKQYWN